MKKIILDKINSITTMPEAKTPRPKRNKSKKIEY